MAAHKLTPKCQLYVRGRQLEPRRLPLGLGQPESPAPPAGAYPGRYRGGVAPGRQTARQLLHRWPGPPLGSSLGTTAAQPGARCPARGAATGQELLSFVAHSNHVYGAAFSPDGLRFATGSADNTARIWTAFPWEAAAYPGPPGAGLAAGIEAYKRQSWQTNQAVRQAADLTPKETQFPRRLGVNSRGDYNLPLAGSKIQPLRPIPPRPGS